MKIINTNENIMIIIFLFIYIYLYIFIQYCRIKLYKYEKFKFIYISFRVIFLFLILYNHYKYYFNGYINFIYTVEIIFDYIFINDIIINKTKFLGLISGFSMFYLGLLNFMSQTMRVYPPFSSIFSVLLIINVFFSKKIYNYLEKHITLNMLR